MKLNKFEMVGIGVSVALMSAALFLVRLDTTGNTNDLLTKSAEENGSQVAAVSAADESAVREALGSSMSGSKVEKLVATDVIIGEGAEVKEGDTVEVNYIGTLQNGQEFDNSYKRGSTFSFTVGEGRVIPGWEAGIIGMKAGGQRILVIPSDMAYGDDGYGPIPGNATLVFAIELVSIQ